MTYISPEKRREWRAEAEAATHNVLSAPQVVRFARRIVALLDQAEAPCGSCHPCTEWAAETWRQTGGPLPHKYRVDEAFAALDRVRALADEWETCGTLPEPRGRIYRTAAANLRAALASDTEEPTP